jgi:hypothetical protein
VHADVYSSIVAAVVDETQAKLGLLRDPIAGRLVGRDSGI